MLKLIPFNAQWITHDKLDLHAIYRRPSRVEDDYGDRVQARGLDGQPIWDITSALPIRQHNAWTAKGFEYVTLANAQGPGGALTYVREAARTGTLRGGTVQDYSQDPRTGGPWNLRKYLDGQQSTRDDGAVELERDIVEFGSVAVEQIRRRTDPGFTLPPYLRDRQPGDTPDAIGAAAVAEGEPVGGKSQHKPAQKTNLRGVSA